MTEEIAGADGGSEPRAPTTSIHVRQAVAGDQASVAWLVERFTPLLLAQARYRLSGDLRALCDPEDLVHDTWAVALPRLADLEPRASSWTPVLLKFLATTLTYRFNNLARKHLRARVARAPAGSSGETDPLDRLPVETRGLLTRVAQRELATATHGLLASLDEEERAIVILRGIEKLPPRDVAGLLDLRPNTVSQKYGRALAKLRSRVDRTLLEAIEDEG